MRISSCLMAAAVLTVGGPALPAEGGAGLSISAAIAPSSSAPDACLCTAEVRDLETGNVLAMPRIVLPRGESGRASVGDSAAFEVVFEVRVDRAGTAADYAVTCRRKGRVVGVQKASLSLRAAD
jgi:hypothetical protein